MIGSGDEDSWRDTNARPNQDPNNSQFICSYDAGESIGFPPVLAIANYGDGRVIAIGDLELWYNWAITYYDNDLLAINIFRWAAKMEY
jgi:hypothetical protein